MFKSEVVQKNCVCNSQLYSLSKSDLHTQNITFCTWVFTFSQNILGKNVHIILWQTTVCIIH